MLVRMAVILLAAALAVCAQQVSYPLYDVWPRSTTLSFYGFYGVSVDKGPRAFGEWEVPVNEVVLDGLPPDVLIRDLSRYRPTVIYGIDPGMRASAWLLNGTPVEYTYTRATALFNTTDVDPRRDVRWYVFRFHYNDIWWLKPVGVRYGLQVTAKSDDRPLLDFSCVKHVKTVTTARGARREVYNMTCPGDVATAYLVDVYFIYVWTGEKKLCIHAETFNAGDVYRIGRGYRALFEHCRPAERPPRNITAVVSPWGERHSRLDIYVDGVRFDTVWIEGPSAKLFTGPYDFARPAAAYVDLNYAGVVLKPLGSAFLLIGNDTVMTPPRYVLKEKGMAWTQARVELTYDGVVVLPGRTYDNSTVYAWPTVPVKIHGRAVELPYRALINTSKLCPGGVRVEGRHRWVGGWVEVRGPASIYCTRYPVTFVTPAGPVVKEADFNTTLTWEPPAIYLPNMTKIEAEPVSVVVDGPKTVVVNYTRVSYLVRLRWLNDTWEAWHLRGQRIHVPGVVVLRNETRLVAYEVAVDGQVISINATPAITLTVDKPMEVEIRYRRQHLVRLAAPVNATETWLDEGAVFKVELADPWEPGNGTLFRTLLVNGTAAREFRVGRPLALFAGYAETYYWAEVSAPINATRGWVKRGAVLRFPEVVDLGNETRLVRPSVREVVVDRPLVLRVEYGGRQHYVRVEGVNKWEGWADAGAVVRLNSTVAEGVEYTPAEVLTAAGPGVYMPLFFAVYRTTARDVLGVPNPLAAVRLCNATAQAALDGSAVVAAYTRETCRPAVEAPPISPYTAAGAATAAVTVALRRRKK